MKRIKSKMLLTTIILSIVNVSLVLIATLSMAFNLFGFADFVEVMIQEYLPVGTTLDNFLMSYYLEVAFIVLINFMAIRFYMRGYKFGVYAPEYGKMMILNSISQLLFSSFIPGIFALITGLQMMNKKEIVPKNIEELKEAKINDVKFEAMSQAVSRLKELREKGVISEEEYYANLNKILES